MNRKVEVLAPAGSYESLVAAVHGGADAVYIGGTKFGARAYADNLSEEQMLEAIDYVHLHDRKIFMTVNTLLKEKEMEEALYDYLLPYYRHGLDAVIVQDLGVLRFVKKHFPDLPIHASTQMTITGVSGARFLKEQGVERVVTARELTLPEIKEIVEETKMEVESFVHGALCYCYSGQCLYSSLIGGRSGNRGQCAQPCRLPYRLEGEKKAEHLLSPKDICTLDLIPDILEAGVYSLKIEGRMKKPEYVAAVTAMYRKYVDLYLKNGKTKYRVEQKDKEILMDLYNRGGFHTGYYKTRNGRDMISLQRPNHAGVPAVQIVSVRGKQVWAKALRNLHGQDVLELPDKESLTLKEGANAGATFLLPFLKRPPKQGTILSRTRNTYLLDEIRAQILNRKTQEKIKGKFILSVGKPAILELIHKETAVRVEGAIVEEAVNRPMEEERIVKQLQKTGNTEFTFEELSVEMAGPVFLPLQSINELRRKGLEMLQEAMLSSYRRTGEIPREREVPNKEPQTCSCDGFYAYVEQEEQLEAVLRNRNVKRIYMDCNLIDRIWEGERCKELTARGKREGKECYLAMPHIFRNDTERLYDRFYEAIFASGIDGVMIRNIESYGFLKSHGFRGKIVLDHNVYQWNKEAVRFWEAQKVDGRTAPLELNINELMELNIRSSELIVYGYLPMMVSAQCVRKTKLGCTKETGLLTMTDRFRKQFSIKNCCNYCYNVIYNTEPLVLLDRAEEIKKAAPLALRLHFTLESEGETQEILKLYGNTFLQGEKETFRGDYTRGHFNRGVT